MKVLFLRAFVWLLLGWGLEEDITSLISGDKNTPAQIDFPSEICEGFPCYRGLPFYCLLIKISISEQRRLRYPSQVGEWIVAKEMMHLLRIKITPCCSFSKRIDSDNFVS